MEETNKLIYKAIAAVMNDIGAVKKEKDFKSNQGSYKFRGIDDVMNALHPAMVKNKIFVVPTILEQTRTTRTTRNGTEMIVSICKIQYDFFAEDGSKVSAVVIGEGMDTGDKATNKAMSIAFKYACFQVFCIPTEEMIDPDGERPELEEEKGTGKEKTSAAKRNAAGKTNKAKAPVEAAADPNKTKVSDVMVSTMRSELKRTGVAENQILNLFKVNGLAEMTIAQFQKAMKKFQATPDKKEDA